MTLYISTILNINLIMSSMVEYFEFTKNRTEKFKIPPRLNCKRSVDII